MDEKIRYPVHNMVWMNDWGEEYSRTLISGTASSGRNPISGNFSARYDSFERQNVQRLADQPVSGIFTLVFSPPAYRNSTVCDCCLVLDDGHSVTDTDHHHQQQLTVGSHG
jgi:hypothetical protein